MSDELPTSTQTDAAVELLEVWDKKRAKLASFAKPVFDYSVGLRMWHHAYGLKTAGKELFDQKLPVDLQVLYVHGYPAGVRNMGFPSRVNVKFTDEKTHTFHSFAYDVREMHPTLAQAVHQNLHECHTLGSRRLALPLYVAARPNVLLRIFDLLFEVPFAAGYGQDHTRLIRQHLTELPASTRAPFAPVPLAVLLRDLRIFFECDDEVERRLDPLHAREERRARVATLETIQAREARAAAAEQAEYWLERDAWEALAHEAVKVPGIGAWVVQVQNGWKQKLDLFLEHEDVAHAQAAMEQSWDRVDNLAFTRRVGRRHSEDWRMTVELLKERNQRAWARAMEWFDAFFEIVEGKVGGASPVPSGALPAHTPASLAKRHSPGLAFKPQSRRQF
ncbi:hypothetical protein JCM10450v2_003377 [Rhodotorula kratochvilovae]